MRLITFGEETLNKELLQNWFEHGLMSFDGVDAKWTRKAKKLVPVPVRTILMNIADGKPIKYQYQIRNLVINNFNEKGFYHV